MAVVAEFYPSRRDPVLGIWAHRQALAAREAGAEMHVLVLNRLVPPRAALAEGPATAARELAAGPASRSPRPSTGCRYLCALRLAAARALLSGLGRWAAAPLGLALAAAAPLVPL